MRHPRGARLTRPAAVLGLDLGTSQVKALLCAPDGTVLGQGTAGYQVSTPRPGWAETNPAHWWQVACTAIRAATGPAPAEVAGLAVAGQMHGVILCTERSVALRPAITWLDRRAEAEAEDYRRLPGDLRARLGNAPSAGMAGPILLWLSRHESDVYGQARWMLQPKDWLRLQLTGPGVQAATDLTDASGTLLFDLAPGGWATDVARALGLRTDLLPAIRRPAEIAGPLLPAAAEHLGLRPGLPVAIGAADTAASLLAAGLPSPSAPSGLSGLPSRLSGLPSGPSGQPSGPWGLLTLGTGGQLIIPLAPNPDIPFPDNPDQGRADYGDKTNLFRSVDGGTYLLAAAQNVGVTLDWVRRTLDASWDELYDTAARPWRADTPVFLPYLAGERWDHRGAGAPGPARPWPTSGRTCFAPPSRGSRSCSAASSTTCAPPAPRARRRSGSRGRPPAPGLASAAGRRPGRAALSGRYRVAHRPRGPLIAAEAIGMAGARSPDRSEDQEKAFAGASRLAEANYRRFRSSASLRVS